MSKKIIAVALAAVSMGAAISHAEVIDTSMLSVKGFGTAGVVHSSEDTADFIGTAYQPQGAGRSHDWDTAIDSKLGVQLSANLNDKLSAVVQAVSQYQYDNTWRPIIEWANVKYQFTPEFSARLGRIVLPAFLISDSRMVGYSNPWVRPPEEVYFDALTTNNDGGDISYRTQINGVLNTVQAFYGTSKARFSTSTMKGKSDWGINDTIEIDALTLRAGYVSYKVDFESSGMEGFYNIINQFASDTAGAYPDASAQAYGVLDQYHLDAIKVKVATLGANYDPGDWFVMGEYAHVKGESFIADSNAFYVTGGYRIAELTPYVTFAQVKTDTINEDGINSAGLPTNYAGTAALLNAGMNAILASTKACQRTASIGLRWDFMPSADLKIQYDHKTLLDDTSGRFLLVPGSSYQGSDHINIVSAAIDFVF